MYISRKCDVTRSVISYLQEKYEVVLMINKMHNSKCFTFTEFAELLKNVVTSLKKEVVGKHSQFKRVCVVLAMEKHIPHMPVYSR